MALSTAFIDADVNASLTLFALLKRVGAKVTKSTVKKSLEQHPDFPSLLSLSDVLTEWQVENVSLQLNTAEQLRELPFPYIAHVRKNGGWFVLITDLKGDTITYHDTLEGRKTEWLTDFEENWSGVVLLAEASEQSVEAEYKAMRRQEVLDELRMPFVMGSAGVLFLLAILSVAATFKTADWVLLVSKTLGLVLSALLISKQTGSKNALTDRLCSINSKTNCDDVLNSPGAKLWGWLSWADVGLLYFDGGLLGVLVTGIQPAVRPLLCGLALLAVPYTVFSVYYQGFVIRQWCTLCLSVQAILLLEAAHATIYLDTLPNFISPYVLTGIIFLLPILIWVILKPLLTASNQSRREYNELVRLKRDPELFRTLLLQRSQMPPIPDDLQPIVLGNPEAEHTITVVTNPYCGPCARTHKDLEQLLGQNQNVKANIIFACDRPDSLVTQAATHALALAKQGKIAQALTDWYAQPAKDFDAWAKRYPVMLIAKDWMAVAEQHGIWCRMAGVEVTPTLFVNGYQLPEQYRLSNLRWSINYLPNRTSTLDLIKSQ